MGQTASSQTAKRGVVVTLDALGTIYKFKEPVADQYLRIAQREGLKSKIDVKDLQKAFRSSYKQRVKEFPNYGKGLLKDPKEWWSGLVDQTFRGLATDVPPDLGTKLYDHFATDEAYELCSDVGPFLQSMHNLRSRYNDPRGPSIVLGIITNSDPRVPGILESLSIRIGATKTPSREGMNAAAIASFRAGQLKTPWHDMYNLQHDFDFLASSYEADSEKPDKQIFKVAEFFAILTVMSKFEQGIEVPDARIQTASKLFFSTLANQPSPSQLRWIHIGDDFEKDFVGAKDFGWDALMLDREGTKIGDGSVSTLEEAAAVINLMAQESFEN